MTILLNSQATQRLQALCGHFIPLLDGLLLGGCLHQRWAAITTAGDHPHTVAFLLRLGGHPSATAVGDTHDHLSASEHGWEGQGVGDTGDSG